MIQVCFFYGPGILRDVKNKRTIQKKKNQGKYCKTYDTFLISQYDG